MALVVRAAVEEFLDAQQLVGEFHGHRIILRPPLFQIRFGQHLGEEGAVDIAAGQDDRDPLAGETPALLQGGGQRRGAGALGDIVRVGEEDAHRPPDLRLRHGDDARRAGADDGERRLVRHADGEPVGDRVGRIGADRPAGGDGERIGRRVGGDDADDLGGLPNASRAAIIAQMPLPSPIGT